MSSLFEMHFHTCETSPCGKVSAGESVPAYKEHGYAGIVVTDHYFRGYFDSLPDSLSWKEKIACWKRGYDAARKAGEACGMTVLLGMEFRFDRNANDYLVYGITVPMLEENPDMFAWTEEAFSRFCRAQGCFFAQAHPFRPHMTRCAAALLDGVEVFNGNRRHDSHNALAADFADKGQLHQLAGSDFHEWEDLQTVGVRFAHRPADSQEMIAQLRGGDYALQLPEA